jgi:RNA polymerase sigma-54 factor
MKLQDIADDISMDVSTISRATRGKYVDTPYGVFELKSFFSESIELKSGEEISNKIIKFELQQLIESEDKTHPLTDEAIMDYLTEKGFPVARRTVAKYRGQLKIPTARLRRQLTH